MDNKEVVNSLIRFIEESNYFTRADLAQPIIPIKNKP